MTTSQLACTFAALALFDDDVPVNAENIQKILKAANIKVESYWPGLFASLIKDKSVGELITGACKGGGGAPSAGAAGAGDTAGEKKVEQKEEEEEEEEKESSKSGPGLFGGDDSDSDSDSE
eukprot:CAMPEP_0202695286 /NCGR_PEP_ID=MMETSP1385-20130828/8918_1 /ASSEMBLY_ACC=CAM_ASM_000861 /TAXON_ID=933848 /ORGANISM="Elphidium margaritaceum" /LENGTH=120 /DNA_ID=CAMNT_0049351287 /DNA_START=73 /DNA_END=435 /DNA_ORIENTATION=-